MHIRDLETETYLDDRKIVKRGSYVVIFTDEKTLPLCCPVCTSAMRSKIDEEEFNKNSCCHLCAQTWAYPNIEKWKKGWRPSQEEIKTTPRATVEFELKID